MYGIKGEKIRKGEVMTIDKFASIINFAMFDARNNPDKFDVDKISYEHAHEYIASIPEITGEWIRQKILNWHNKLPLKPHLEDYLATAINKKVRAEK
jgi:hypothetical protein